MELKQNGIVAAFVILLNIVMMFKATIQYRIMMKLLFTPRFLHRVGYITLMVCSHLLVNEALDTILRGH